LSKVGGDQLIGDHGYNKVKGDRSPPVPMVVTPVTADPVGLEHHCQASLSCLSGRHVVLIDD